MQDNHKTCPKYIHILRMHLCQLSRIEVEFPGLLYRSLTFPDIEEQHLKVNFHTYFWCFRGKLLNILCIFVVKSAELSF